MAPKNTPQQRHGTTLQVVPEGQEPQLGAVPEWTWDDLPDPVEVPETTAFPGVKANVLSTVPEPIRRRAEASLTVNAKRVAAKTGSSAKRSRVRYHWDLQIVPSEEKGNEFIKAITRYAKYRPDTQDIPHSGEDAPRGQVTARCGGVQHFRRQIDGTYIAVSPDFDGAVLAVRYSVRPFEARKDTAKVPGSE